MNQDLESATLQNSKLETIRKESKKEMQLNNVYYNESRMLGDSFQPSGSIKFETDGSLMDGKPGANELVYSNQHFKSPVNQYKQMFAKEWLNEKKQANQKSQSWLNYNTISFVIIACVSATKLLKS